jgi:hypothetical protein
VGVHDRVFGCGLVGSESGISKISTPGVLVVKALTISLSVPESGICNLKSRTVRGHLAGSRLVKEAVKAGSGEQNEEGQ